MHAHVRNTHGAVSLQITARTVPVYVAKGVRALLERPNPPRKSSHAGKAPC
ncbi:hypothetical protein DAD186_15060 [Dermabacter vaginalis]|uniref:Uncharacterized protein n=1 Tax=Dermabacter vaginalis TaxID=1630135 RepID=A0A1B0ZJC3_9MICO|nr:hypothetical protein DAD186_15060 [Dermabacter vaginalis]